MSWADRFAVLFRSSKLNAELDEELQFHVEARTRDNIAAGMTPDEARRQARIAFGTSGRIKEECREVRYLQWLGTVSMRQSLTVDSNSNADRSNRAPLSEICEIAVDNYGLVTARQALKDAELTGVDTTGSGPFILAWSPSTNKDKEGVSVLVANLSNVTTYAQANEIFLLWAIGIEANPKMWSKGWDANQLRRDIRLWVDKYGPRILGLFGIEE
jgi:hypothetical protein